MTENQFKFNKDTVATNLKTPLVFNNETMSISEVLNKLNELNDENEQLRKENEFLKKRCDEYWEEAGLNNDYFE